VAEQLKIVIDADVVKAIGGLDKLEKHFKETQNSAKSFGVNIAKGTSQATTALAKVPTTSNAATQSLLNLSRVAQDAPFGFIGIANNLNPLLESFQRLKVSAKEAGTSVKSALVGALTGPAGIGLALGVGSSLLIAFGDDLLRLLSPSQKLSDALDKAAESITKNVGQVTVYVEALKSGTLSTEQTKKVQKELIDQAPEFQSAFKGNSVNVEELDRILATKYIPQLVKSIKVTAAFGIVNETLAKSIKQIAKGGQDFDFGDKVKTFLAGFGGISGGVSAAAKTAVKNVEEAQKDLTSDSISNLIEKIFNSLGISLSDAADAITTGGKKVSKAIGTLKDDTLERARAFIKQFGDVFVVPDLDISFTNTKEKVAAAAKKLISDIDKGLLITRTFGVRQIQIPVELELVPVGKSLQELRDNLFKGLNVFGDKSKTIKGIVPGVSEDVAKRNKEFFDAFQQQILATAGLVTDILAPAFTGMFDAITASENPLKAFFNGLKDSVNQLIKKLIQAALQAAVLSALSGGSTSFVGAFSKILGFAGGGRANFGLGGAIGNRSFQNSFQVEGETIIRGNDLVTIIRRQNNSNQRGG